MRRCSPRRAATSPSASNSSRPRPMPWPRRCGARSRRWRRLKPRFVSVTYGAGGSTRERTHATVERIVKETELTPAAHLTCVGATREEIDAIARSYWDVGRAPYRRAARRYARAGPALCASSGRLCQCRRAGCRAEVAWRRSKSRSRPIPRSIPIPIARRATSTICCKQDRRRRRPGDHPILLLGRLLLPLPRPGRRDAVRTSKSCRASCRSPTWPRRAASPASAARRSRTGWTGCSRGSTSFPQARQLVAATIAGELCGQLYAGGVRHFHFYTLNRAELAYAICHLLGVRA